MEGRADMTFRAVIAARYPLDRFREAMTEAAAGRSAGCVVLEMA